MDCLVYEPGEPGRVAKIPDTVGAIQEAVGGYFEVLLDDRAACANDDGLALGLAHDRRFGLHHVVRPALVTTHDEPGDTAGLSDEDVVRIRAPYV